MVEKKKTYVKASTGGLNRPLRMVKMIQARCRICNEGGHGKRGWWENCPHDPYFHLEDLPVDPMASLVQEEDGTYVTSDTPSKPKFKKVPNMKQVPLDDKAASGRMVQIQIERGSKVPEELGYYPICDYRNCWVPLAGPDAPKPVHQTQKGNYHSRDEAAIISLQQAGKPIYLGLGQDIERRREQLDQVNIR